MNKRISIIGLGWLGEPLAVELHQQGYEVLGSTTRCSRLPELRQHPFYVGHLESQTDQIVGDWEKLTSAIDILIINFPPRRIEDIEHIYPQQIKQLIRGTKPTTKVIFVSSTSVYANNNDWVKETILTNPTKASGKAVLAGEQLLRAHFGAKLTVLRFAGLIGPNRHPGKFLANKRALKNPTAPVNLIHQVDCIGLIQAIIQKDCFGEIINGCADKHPTRKDYYTKAAVALGLTAPTFVDDEQSDYKVIDNSKSKTILAFRYAYPNPEKMLR